MQAVSLFSSRAAALVSRVSQLRRSTLERVCTPFTKSEEKRGCSQSTWGVFRLLPIVLVKKHLMLKAVLVFCQKSAEIMLIFLKSARGLQKNAHFFPIFINVEYYIFQIFSYSFQQQNGRIRSRAISALGGWLLLLLDDNLDDAILERVWTGFLEGNRWPIKPIPQASSAPLTKMRAKCGFGRHK